MAQTGPDVATTVRHCDHCNRDIPVNFDLHTQHCQRLIKCQKCDARVNKNVLQEHEDTVHRLVQCTLCQESVETQHQQTHKLSCQKALVSCTYCSLDLPRGQVGPHEVYCGARTEPCDTCKQYVKISDWTQHQTSQCQHPPRKSVSETSSQQHLQPVKWTMEDQVLKLEVLQQILRDRKKFPEYQKNPRKFLGDHTSSGIQYMFHQGQKVSAVIDMEYLKNEVGISEDLCQYIGRVACVTGGDSQNIRMTFSNGRSLYCLAPYTHHCPELYNEIDDSTSFKWLDLVTVRSDLSLEQLKDMTPTGFKWTDQTQHFIARRGLVIRVYEDADCVLVEYPTKYRCILSNKVLQHVNEQHDVLKQDDRVLITSNRNRAISQQDNAGGWVDNMTMCLGECGEVRRFLSPNKYEVRSPSGKFLWNRKSLRLFATTDEIRQCLRVK